MSSQREEHHSIVQLVPVAEDKREEEYLSKQTLSSGSIYKFTNLGFKRVFEIVHTHSPYNIQYPGVTVRCLLLEYYISLNRRHSYNFSLFVFVQLLFNGWRLFKGSTFSFGKPGDIKQRTASYPCMGNAARPGALRCRVRHSTREQLATHVWVIQLSLVHYAAG